MNAAAVATGDKRDYRSRPKRISKAPAHEILKTRMDELGLSNSDVQKELGYPKPNVIAMMRNNTMRIPINKAGKLARLLQVDPQYFIIKVLEESDAALADVLRESIGESLVTSNELKLINKVREWLDGHDLDVSAIPGIATALKPMVKQAAAAATQETKATLARIDREAKPGPKPAAKQGD